MKLLISNLWLLFLLAVFLAGISYAVIDKPLFEAKYCFLTAVFAAIPDLIAISGIWFTRKSCTVPAIVIAVLCCAAVITAALLFFTNSDFAPARTAGIAAGLLGVLSVILCIAAFSGNTKQIVLYACCLCGILGINYVTGFLVALITGFQRA